MQHSLYRQVEQHLATHRPWLAFEPDLEARFEVDTGRQRCRHLFFAGLVALAVYDLFILNDFTLRREAVGTAALLRFGVITPYGVLVLWLLHRGLPPRARELVMTSTVILAVFVSCVIFSLSNSPTAIIDPFSFGLIILGGNIVFSLRFPYALASTLIGLATLAAFLGMYHPMQAELKLFALMVATSTGVFTLFANYRLEASERTSYLLLLRETLRASSAIRDNQALTRISYTDPLTGLANRRQFDERIVAHWQDAIRLGTPLGLLMIDVDSFKAYNDYYGHPKGDACLVQVGRELQRQVRGDFDLVARLGGEEFAMLLPGAGPEAAQLAGERARAAVEALSIAHEGVGGAHVLTVSVGWAVLVPGAEVGIDDLRAAADSALYQAKRKGRNRVEGDDPGTGSGLRCA